MPPPVETLTTRRSKITAELARVAGALFSPNLKEDEKDEKSEKQRERDEREEKYEIEREIEGKEDSDENDEKVDDEDDQEEEADDDDEEEFNPYLFIACLPPHAYVAIKNKIRLPPQTDRKR